MSNRIEYNGHVIEPTTKRTEKADRWTLEVRITTPDQSAGARRCRAPNTYPSKEVAVEHCLEFGRRIVDGKLQPKAGPTT